MKLQSSSTSSIANAAAERLDNLLLKLVPQRLRRIFVGTTGSDASDVTRLTGL